MSMIATQWITRSLPIESCLHGHLGAGHSPFVPCHGLNVYPPMFYVGNYLQIIMAFGDEALGDNWMMS